MIFILLTACSGGSSVTTWQEQYDLGIQYLTEGDYEAAIVAFTAAIEIDPNEAAYLGRADAYVQTVDIEENLTLAFADYETVLTLDESSVDAYIGLAQIYVLWGDYSSALEILQEGLVKTGNASEIEDMINEVTSLYIDDMAAHEDFSFLFEGEILILEEWTVNGTRITEATFDDFWTAYPCVLWDYDRWYDLYYNGNSVGSRYYSPWIYSAPVTNPEDGRANDNRQGNLSVNPEEDANGNFGWVAFDYNEYDNYQPELRGIQMGDDMSSVLLKLGFSDAGVKFLLERKQLWEEALESDMSYDEACAVCEDVFGDEFEHYSVYSDGITVSITLSPRGTSNADNELKYDGMTIGVSYFYNENYNQIYLTFSSEEILTRLSLNGN